MLDNVFFLFVTLYSIASFTTVENSNSFEVHTMHKGRTPPLSFFKKEVAKVGLLCAFSGFHHHNLLCFVSNLVNLVPWNHTFSYSVKRNFEEVTKH